MINPKEESIVNPTLTLTDVSLALEASVLPALLSLNQN